jgi:hypothetical protein
MLKQMLRDQRRPARTTPVCRCTAVRPVQFNAVHTLGQKQSCVHGACVHRLAHVDQAAMESGLLTYRREQNNRHAGFQACAAVYFLLHELLLQ